MRLLMVILMVVSWGKLIAQPYEMQVFNQENRLINHSWGRIVEDKSGYLWMSGFRGLTRFDGQHFMTIHNGSSANIRYDIDDLDRLYKLKTNEIAYIKTEDEIEIFNPETFQFRVLSLKAFTATPSVIVSINVYEDGDLYICLEAATGIVALRYDGRTLTPILKQIEKRDNAITVHSPGNAKLLLVPFSAFQYFFFDGNKGHFFYDQRENEYTPITLPDWLKGLEAWPCFIVKDKKGQWLFSFARIDGLFTFNAQEEIVPHPNIDQNLRYRNGRKDEKGNVILEVVEGRKRFLLYEPDRGIVHEIGTFSNRVWRESELWSKNFKEYFFYTGENGLVYRHRPTYSISSVLKQSTTNQSGVSMRGMIELTNGKVLIGTDNHGIHLYDPALDTATSVETPVDWPPDLKTVISSRTLLKDIAGNVWLTAYMRNTENERPAGYLVKFDEKTMELNAFCPLSSRVNTMAFINDSLLLAGIESELFTINLKSDVRIKVLKKTLTGHNFFYGIEKIIPLPEDGHFLLVTATGLYRFDYEQNKIEKILVQESQVDHYFDVYQENAASWWIGTNGDGLYRYNTITGKLEVFGFKQGILSDIVCGIVPEGEDYLMLSTYRGLYRFDKRQGIASNKALQNGLAEYEFNRNSYVGLSDNSWLFGGVNGFYHVAKVNGVATEEVTAPKVLLSYVQFRNENAEQDTVIYNFHNRSEELTLPANARRLQVQVSNFNPEEKANLLLHFRLHSSERWELLPKSGELTFNFIPPGHYRLQVADRTNDELLFDLPIYAKWRWYERTSFQLAGGMLVLTLIGLLLYFYFKGELIRVQSSQLEENEKFRQRLFAYIAHEFKTPLTIIFGLAHRLRKAPENKVIADQLKIIEVHGTSMTSLVNQMIELNELQANEWQPDYALADLVKQIKLIVVQLQPLADSLNAKLELHTTENAIYQWSDFERLKVIVNNLVSNALKFSPLDGKVEVSVAAEETTWSLTVRDQGPGIREEEIEHISNLFYRSSQQHDKELPNAGIGLAYVKAIVEAMNGRMDIYNDRGSVFKVIFPFQAIDGALMSEEISEEAVTLNAQVVVAEGADAQKGRELVLLVEDTPAMANYVKSCFPSEKYQVVWARNGEEGEQQAIALVPDIIVSDVRMPGKNGFELCAALKTHPVTNHIPIVMLTALADKDSRLTGLQARADVYLAKPFREKELVLTVANLLYTREQTRLLYTNDRKRSERNTILPTYPQHDEFKQNIDQVLENHFNDPLFGVEEMSRALFLSRTQLHRKSKALLGKNPGDLLRTYRLQRAKEMLDLTEFPIVRIAQECGFNDASYFTKVFTAAYHITPSKYRK